MYDDDQGKAGAIAAICAFVFWGMAPVYWKQVAHVPAFEVLCHRILWSLFFVGIMLSVRSSWGTFKAIFSSKKTMLLLTMSGLLVGGNWGLYIWAVNSGMVLQTSLGYYITPLVSMLLGVIVFKDTIRPIQLCAVFLAVAGVGTQLIMVGQLPWVSLVLAVSFGLYGLLRKLAAVESLAGLMFETVLLVPFVLFYLGNLELQGTASFLHVDRLTDMYLLGAGIITSLPLMWFAYAACRLRLTTLGLLQYIAPSLAFLQGVFLFNEPFTMGHLFTFMFIWSALALYSGEGWLQRSRKYLHAEEV
ncbi:EamA family transporter RarD [Halodesulfovibrio marinisediminis]|uniref:Chloramphenicol-sensitive protein RarD n=1 Tax=Halodesulfovibrio marinisediminis DSM 17456 TaxID=1121457 RepID=A0A1N6IJC8_9BACT|nr:EamA family transporter RarD [Halodesulfovibrio marinisediminis]SIO32101.1 chloramphenicol-sensitive protein RarD [Halodesulfovibrio marinisediminis DSM 17456]